MSGLAGQLGDGSIKTLDAAAPWRLAEADILRERGRPGAALYFYGYVAEIRLCAACLRLYPFEPNEPIGIGQINQLKAEARGLHLMSSDPHHVAGWGRYLVHLRKDRKRWFGRGLRDRILCHADGLYEHWRPRLRYKALKPTAAQIKVVRVAADWFNECYPQFWS